MANAAQNEWVARVLGVAVPAGEQGPDLKDRLAAIAADLKRVANPADLTAALRAAIAMAKDGLPEAESAVAALEDELAERTRAARIAAMTAELSAARPSKAGFVAVAKARLEWAEVEASAEMAAGNLVDSAYALLETPPYRDDPRAADPAATGLIEALRGRLPSMAPVRAAVDAALDSGGPGRAQAIAAAVKTIDQFLPQLDTDPDLLTLETAAGDYPSVSLVRAALAKLRAVLGEVETDIKTDIKTGTPDATVRSAA